MRRRECGREPCRSRGQCQRGGLLGSQRHSAAEASGGRGPGVKGAGRWSPGRGKICRTVKAVGFHHHCDGKLSREEVLSDIHPASKFKRFGLGKTLLSE